MTHRLNCFFYNNNIIISIITVFAGVLFVDQPGANHASRASVTQVNHSVHTLRTFLIIIIVIIIMIIMIITFFVIGMSIM